MTQRFNNSSHGWRNSRWAASDFSTRSWLPRFSRPAFSRCSPRIPQTSRCSACLRALLHEPKLPNAGPFGKTAHLRQPQLTENGEVRIAGAGNLLEGSLHAPFAYFVRLPVHDGLLRFRLSLDPANAGDCRDRARCQGVSGDRRCDLLWIDNFPARFSTYRGNIGNIRRDSGTSNSVLCLSIHGVPDSRLQLAYRDRPPLSTGLRNGNDRIETVIDILVEETARTSRLEKSGNPGSEGIGNLGHLTACRVPDGLHQSQ